GRQPFLAHAERFCPLKLFLCERVETEFVIAATEMTNEHRYEPRYQARILLLALEAASLLAPFQRASARKLFVSERLRTRIVRPGFSANSRTSSVSTLGIGALLLVALFRAMQSHKTSQFRLRLGCYPQPAIALRPLGQLRWRTSLGCCNVRRSPAGLQCAVEDHPCRSGSFKGSIMPSRR